MSLVIPSIFRAIDQLSGPLRGMGRSLSDFADRAESAGQRASKALGAVRDKAGNIATATAAAGAALLAPVALVTKSAADYEKALNSFRTIVSDLTDKEFSEFEKKAFEIAKTSGSSATTVVQSFEKISGLNAEFAASAEGLGKISEAAITLSRASGDELEASTESLVGIMNQFGYAAEKAKSTINVLAAGQAVGAASIGQTSEALKVFGAVAKGSNVTLEQSVALIETLAAKQIIGSEAGTALRGAIVRLQKAGLGYKSGLFQINDALDDAGKKFRSLATAKAKDAYITNLFGMENLTAGKILLDNVGKIKEFTQSVTDTSEAQKAAAINSQGFYARLDQLKSRVETLMISVGTKFLPVLEGLADRVVPVLNRIGDWIEQNPQLTKGIIIATAALGGMLLVISAISAAIAAIASPVGIVIAGISAIGSAGTYAYKKSEKFRGAVDSLWGALKDLGGGLWSIVKVVGGVLMSVFSNVAKLVVGVLSPVFRILGKVFQGIGWIFEKVVGVIGDHPWIGKIAKGIMWLVTGPLKVLSWALEKIADLLDSVFPKTVESPGVQFNPLTGVTTAQFSGMPKSPVGVLAAPAGFKTPDAAVPVASTGGVDQAQMDQLKELVQQVRGSVDVNVSAAPGSNATVTGSSGIAKPKTTSTQNPW